MKIFFCVFFVILRLTSAQLNLTDAQITQLSNVLETEVPGSVHWLHQWAVGESMIDEISAIVDGRKPPSPQIKKSSVALYLFSLNPEIPLGIFLVILERIYGSSHSPIEELVRQYMQMHSSKSIPDWMFQHLSQAKRAGQSRESIHASVLQLTDNMRNQGRIDVRDIRFNRGPQAIRALTAMWILVGIPNPNDTTHLSVSFNPVSREWSLTRETQQEVFRYLTIMNQK